MTIDAITNQWALLGLIACDASYENGDLRGRRLKTFQDSNPNKDFLPIDIVTNSGIAAHQIGNDIEVDDWQCIRTIDDQPTGFHAVIYQNDAKTKAIIAFRGTNGWGDGKGWWTDLAFGEQQWTRNARTVETAIAQLQDIDGGTFSGE